MHQILVLIAYMREYSSTNTPADVSSEARGLHGSLSLYPSLLFDFSLTAKAVPHECKIRTGQPYI